VKPARHAAETAGPVQFARGRIRRTAENPPSEHDGKPTHRRRGLARACLTRLVRHSMDRGRLPRAIVAERNEAALALGERLGFPCRTEVTSWFLDIF